MKLTFRFLLLAAVIGLSSCGNKNKMSWNVYSPDSTVCMELCLCPGGSLQYNVILEKDTMLNWSSLGMERKDGKFSDGLSLVGVEPIKDIDETYKMKIGKRSVCNVHANEGTFTFKNAKGLKIQVVIRAANDGVAFKYRFPDQDTAAYSMTDEYTAFSVPAGKAWMAPYDSATQWSPAYETYYQNGIETGTKSPRPEGWGFPMLFNTNDKWMLITEANTSENCFAAHVKNDESSAVYKIVLPEAAEGAGLGTVEAISSLPWESSWRVISVGRNLAAIFESTLVTDVCDAAIEGDFSWVKPGRAGWSWWSANDSPKEVQPQKEYIDLAKEMGWEYVLVDANWDSMSGGNIMDVIKYAKAKGVGIWLWYNSGGPHTVVTERPRNRMFEAGIRVAEMKQLKEWGVKGIKVDFFGSDKQFLNKLSHEILRDAAKYQIMINFHGCTLPKGWSRTYPNLLSMEAVKGAECYIFDASYPENAPVVNCIYPFTRNVVGPMDYTPVAFSNNKYPHKTTYGFELATSVVFECGVLHFADKVSAYKNLPAAPKQFLKEVPATWDDSKLIDGYPGKYVLVARKKGQDWYLAGLNALNENKDVTINLDFLGAGKYSASVIADGKGPQGFYSDKKKVTSDDALKIAMLPYGGFVVKITR